MKYKAFLLVLMLANMVGNFAFAEEITVNYKSFYSHVRKLNNDDLNALQFAFGFQHIREPRLCKVSSAKISTEKQQIPLVVTDEGRFTVPSEKALNLAKAKVVIDLKEQANLCDMSVQLETKPEYLKTTYQQSELQHIYNQYDAFFDKMGSFLSFMMPSVIGISLHVENVSEEELHFLGQGEQVKFDGKKIEFTKDALSNMSEITLPEKPLRITALTNK